MFWSYSSLFKASPPNWQGFMSKVNAGHADCTTVVYNLKIPLNPSTNDDVYSTMTFVQQQTNKLGMCCASLTFDQPLYINSYIIKQDNQHQCKHINLRLVGFHQLMSFLGVGCIIMEGSGLEDLWGTVYATGYIPKIHTSSCMSSNECNLYLKCY